MGSEISKNKIRKLNKQVSSTNLLYNIKSKYIMKQIVENLHKIKILKLINYNKNIQEKLEISLNDYKDYSLIELELMPKAQKITSNFFINYNKKDEKYFHIYFNDQTKEIHRNYFIWNDEVKKVKIIINSKIKSFTNLFSESICIKTINFINFKNNNIKNMNRMFFNCLVETINFNNFNTDVS